MSVDNDDKIVMVRATLSVVVPMYPSDARDFLRQGSPYIENEVGASFVDHFPLPLGAKPKATLRIEKEVVGCDTLPCRRCKNDIYRTDSGEAINLDGVGPFCSDCSSTYTTEWENEINNPPTIMVLIGLDKD